MVQEAVESPAGIAKITSGYKILIIKCHRYEDNIKMYLTQLGCENVN
jgi:hypothetical protein